jgi:hypothetical protein
LFARVGGGLASIARLKWTRLSKIPFGAGRGSSPLLDSFTAVQLARASLSEGGAGGVLMSRGKRSTPSSRNKDEGARANWGGKRKDAGRKRELAEPTRREIASGYLTYRRREHLDRQAAIHRLMADFYVTHRMVVRCLDEFWAAAKPDADIFGYAVEGMNEIKDLPKEENEIRKLKPGVYADRKLRGLRLDVDSKGQWIFCFFWRKGHFAEFRELVLGESTMSLENARKLAKEARRKLVEGQNPIDGSWENAVLERVKSKS